MIVSRWWTERPVAVDSLWRTRAAVAGLREPSDGLIVVHPIVVAGLARRRGHRGRDSQPNDVVVQPRSWLLTQACRMPDRKRRWWWRSPSGWWRSSVPRLSRVPRRTEPRLVAEEVASVVAAMTARPVVLIDAPSTVAGAAALATLIAERGAGWRRADAWWKSTTRGCRNWPRRRRGTDRITDEPRSPTCRWRPITRPAAGWACGRRCRPGRGGAGCGREWAGTGCRPHDEGADDISGRRPGSADGSGELAHAARGRRARFGAGAGHVAVGSRGGVARHPITGSPTRRSSAHGRAVETSDRRGAGRGVCRLQPVRNQRRTARGDLPRSARRPPGAVDGVARRSRSGSASDARAGRAVRTPSARCASRRCGPPTRWMSPKSMEPKPSGRTTVGRR